MTWIVNPAIGFISLVAHRDFPGLLLVRGRERAHLEELRQRHLDLLREAVIESTPEADYSCRFTASATVMAEIVRREIEAINYPNVKDAAGLRWGYGSPFLAALHACWSVLRRWQFTVQQSPRSFRPSGQRGSDSEVQP